MGLRAWFWVCLLTACAPAPVEHAPSMFFGDVALGDSRQVALTITNPAEQAQTLRFQILDGDFAIDESSRTLAKNETTTLLVRFTPTDLGPRTGRLAIDGTELTLSGRGTGARLSAPAQLLLGRVVIFSHQEKIENAVLSIRNTGTTGSSLRLGAPRVDSNEVCVGEFVSGVCTAWIPPAALDTQTVLQVPISIRATTPGSRRWEIVFPSNDLLHPEVSVEFLSFVEAVEPCVFAPVSAVVLGNEPGTLQLTHTGPGTCMIRELRLIPTSALAFVSEPSLPIRVQSGESFAASISLRPGAPLQLTGFVHVVAEGTEPVDVPVRREVPGGSCLVVSAPVIQFGTLAQTCVSADRYVQLYNRCASPLTIRAISLFATGGEPAGTPGCPGATPCQEFFVSAPQASTVLAPGGAPVSFSVNYRPAGLGEDNGAVLIDTVEEPSTLVSLSGRAAPPPINVDTYRQDTLARADVLVMVDSSPSFVPKRAAVRDNLQRLMSQNIACSDARWAFAAADGDLDAGVALLLNDAGERWSSTLDFDFVNRALSALDALPVGSETEACIGPAADLLLDAGVRAGSTLAGLCITDALEQTANPTSALQLFRSGASNSTWSTITGTESSVCAVEAHDDGVHQGLVVSSSGLRADICDTGWSREFIGGSVCTPPRLQFFLTSRPAGPIEVTVDGQPVPSADWSFDVGTNSVTFALLRMPAPGQTVTMRYSTPCTP